MRRYVETRSLARWTRVNDSADRMNLTLDGVFLLDRDLNLIRLDR